MIAVQHLGGSGARGEESSAAEQGVYVHIRQKLPNVAHYTAAAERHRHHRHDHEG